MNDFTKVEESKRNYRRELAIKAAVFKETELKEEFGHAHSARIGH